MRYYVISDAYGNIIGYSNCPCTSEGRICTEVTSDVFLSVESYGANYYKRQGTEIVLNPNYAAEQEAKAKELRIAEIKNDLAQLDLATIRALRANETDILAQYESQAILLRNELHTLIGEQ